jgi:hypothetical protein
MSSGGKAWPRKSLQRWATRTRTLILRCRRTCVHASNGRLCTMRGCGLRERAPHFKSTTTRKPRHPAPAPPTATHTAHRDTAPDPRPPDHRGQNATHSHVAACCRP